MAVDVLSKEKLNKWWIHIHCNFFLHYNKTSLSTEILNLNTQELLQHWSCKKVRRQGVVSILFFKALIKEQAHELKLTMMVLWRIQKDFLKFEYKHADKKIKMWLEEIMIN